MSKQNELIKLAKEYLVQQQETGEKWVMLKAPFLTKDVSKNKRNLPDKSGNYKIAADNQKSKQLRSLYEQYKSCQSCPLGKTRINFVFGVGNPDTELMFVGEGPGFDEDHKGEPFVGRAGKRLNDLIYRMGFDREEIYIGNVVKCHPMKDPSNPEQHNNDRQPTADEMEPCMPILEQQISIIKPKIICALGSVAANALLKTELALGKLRGRIYDYTTSQGVETKLVPTYHPAAILRNPSWAWPTWDDALMILNYLGRKPRPKE